MDEAMKMERLIDEFIYQRSLIGKGKLRQHFREYTPEFIALHSVSQIEKEKCDNTGKVYLKELADKMEITIRQASRVAGNLRDKGFVRWSHDGDGCEGTYIEMKEAGRAFLRNQEEHLKAYYRKVSEIYGMDNLTELLSMLKHLENVINQIPKETGMNDA